jgi:hypothetical protein
MGNYVHLGVPADEFNGRQIVHPETPVDLEIFHTLFSGQTNLSGKTTTIKTLLPRVIEEGYTVLVFDTKPTVREFEGYHDIPLCYKPTTDALVLIGLLESVRKSRLSPYYATLSRLTEGAKNLNDIVENAEEMEKNSRSGFIKDAAHTLADLIRRLQLELEGLFLTSGLSLEREQVNVMSLNGLSVETQQLIVKSAFEAALKHKRLILVLDEGWRFLPEQYSSACKRAIQDVVTQGAKTGLFFWMATQFLAPTDKDAMKAMANKLIGRQDHPTEVKHSQDLIPDGKKAWPNKAVMTLKRGEFIFVPMDGETRKIYVDNPVLDEPHPVKGQQEWSDGRIHPFGDQRALVGPITEAIEAGVPVKPWNEKSASPPIMLSTPKVKGGFFDKAFNTPKPETKTLASFTLEVTRLRSNSTEGMLAYLVKNHGSLRQSEMIAKAREYGWVLSKQAVSDAANRLVIVGTFMEPDTNHRYKFPTNDSFKVVEVPA